MSKQQNTGFIRRIVGYFTSHLRQATASLGELWRTPVSSLMTIVVLGMSLSLPSALYVLQKNAQQIAASWQDATQITLFLETSLDSDQVQRLQQKIAVMKQVDEVGLISKKEALAEFKEASGFGEALQYLDSNPLPDVLVVTPGIHSRAPATLKRLLQTLQGLEGVDQGKLDMQWLQRLQAVVNLVQSTMSSLALLLCLTVVLIIGNTIRLAIMNRRREIEILKLVGATDAFIQRPFLYTGFWYGLIGAFLSWIIIGVLLWWIESALDQLTQLYHQQVHLIGLSFGESLSLMAIAIFLGLAGAYISVYRHIKAIEPA